MLILTVACTCRRVVGSCWRVPMPAGSVSVAATAAGPLVGQHTLASHGGLGPIGSGPFGVENGRSIPAIALGNDAGEGAVDFASDARPKVPVRLTPGMGI